MFAIKDPSVTESCWTFPLLMRTNRFRMAHVTVRIPNRWMKTVEPTKESGASPSGVEDFMMLSTESISIILSILTIVQRYCII